MDLILPQTLSLTVFNQGGQIGSLDITRTQLPSDALESPAILDTNRVQSVEGVAEPFFVCISPGVRGRKGERYNEAIHAVEDV